MGPRFESWRGDENNKGFEDNLQNMTKANSSSIIFSY